MTPLRISLFGKLQIESDGRFFSTGLDGRKAQELLSYLVIYREQLHPRENLADVLWGNSIGIQSRKYLRQALWQLQAALKPDGSHEDDGLLIADAEWLGISPESSVWIDVTQFERSYAGVQGKPGHELDDEAAKSVAAAVDLYKGGLLQGWYQDWCLFERQRFEIMYLAMLNKLMTYHEASERFELGMSYGQRILQFDRAQERTHWHIMRMHYLSGDRTGALRQYDKCVAALEEELGVKPARWMTALYEQIRADNVEDTAVVDHYSRPDLTVRQNVPANSTVDIDRLQALLSECQNGLERYFQLSGSPSGD
jgi:DNA-binding SARP family transcriptional activator